METERIEVFDGEGNVVDGIERGTVLFCHKKTLDVRAEHSLGLFGIMKLIEPFKIRFPERSIEGLFILDQATGDTVKFKNSGPVE